MNHNCKLVPRLNAEQGLMIGNVLFRCIQILSTKLISSFIFFSLYLLSLYIQCKSNANIFALKIVFIETMSVSGSG